MPFYPQGHTLFCGEQPAGGAALLTEVGQLELSQVADEQVVRLQVSVQDPAAVDVAEASQQLEHEDLQQSAAPSVHTAERTVPAAPPAVWTYAHVVRVQTSGVLRHVLGQVCLLQEKPD